MDPDPGHFFKITEFLWQKIIFKFFVYLFRLFLS